MGGGVKMLTILYRPISCDILFKQCTLQKSSDVYQRFLRHPWPKWDSVKVHQLSKFGRVELQTYKLHQCFCFTRPFKKDGLSDGLTLTILLQAAPKKGSYNFYRKIFFRGSSLEMVRQNKTNQ